jgi:hypothetical protein
VILWQDRQMNFSGTVWITFHWRGTSRVSADLTAQAGQEQGGGITTRSRGRWGQGRPHRRRRVKLLTTAERPHSRITGAAATW